MSLTDIVAIEGYIQTTFLAVYPDKLLLLDAGCLCDVQKILTYITDTLKRPVTELKTVMVTHMHPDHAGGAHLLQQKTGCQIVTASHYKPWYSGVQGRVSHLKDIMLTYYVATRQGKQATYLWYPPVLKADITVKEGDKIPSFDDWEVIETAGHTDRDISFWHAATEQVYIADLILKIKTKFVSPFLITLPFVYRSSVAKIRDLEPKQVLLAHGSHQKMSLEDFEGIIKRAPVRPRVMDIRHSVDILKLQLKFRRKRAETL